MVPGPWDSGASHFEFWTKLLVLLDFDTFTSQYSNMVEDDKAGNSFTSLHLQGAL